MLHPACESWVGWIEIRINVCACVYVYVHTSMCLFCFHAHEYNLCTCTYVWTHRSKACWKFLFFCFLCIDILFSSFSWCSFTLLFTEQLVKHFYKDRQTYYMYWYFPFRRWRRTLMKPRGVAWGFHMLPRERETNGCFWVRGEKSRLATAVKDAMVRPKITLLDIPTPSWDRAPNVATAMLHLPKLYPACHTYKYFSLFQYL